MTGTPQKISTSPAPPLFREATEEDAYALAPRLCPRDREELIASGSKGPLYSLLYAMQAPGSIVHTVVDNRGLVLMMFGALPHPHEKGVGVIWALSSPEVTHYRRTFLEEGRRWVEALHQTFPVLMNFTDCRNRENHRWIKWLGFEFLEPVQGGGHENLPFYPFISKRGAPCASRSH